MLTFGNPESSLSVNSGSGASTGWGTSEPLGTPSVDYSDRD